MNPYKRVRSPFLYNEIAINDIPKRHVYIYAPFEERLRNCVDILKMDEKEAGKTIKEVDKMRDAYHKRYAGFLPGDPEHKNILIDSSMLGVNGTAKYLAELISYKFSSEEGEI